MKQVFVLTSLFVILFKVSPVAAVPEQQEKIKSFAQWCQQIVFVPAATRQTIKVLLIKAGTEVGRLPDSR